MAWVTLSAADTWEAEDSGPAFKGKTRVHLPGPRTGLHFPSCSCCMQLSGDQCLVDAKMPKVQQMKPWKSLESVLLMSVQSWRQLLLRYTPPVLEERPCLQHPSPDHSLPAFLIFTARRAGRAFLEGSVTHGWSDCCHLPTSLERRSRPFGAASLKILLVDV